MYWGGRLTFKLPGVSAGADGTAAAALEVGELAAVDGSGAPYCAAVRAGSRKIAKIGGNIAKLDVRERVYRASKRDEGYNNEFTRLGCGESVGVTCGYISQGNGNDIPGTCQEQFVRSHQKVAHAKYFMARR